MQAAEFEELATSPIRRGWSPLAAFLGGALESVGIAALFVVGGLAWAASLDTGRVPAGYPPGVEQPRTTPRIWLVDGYNALNVGLLAGRSRQDWWGAERRGELLARVERFEEPEAEIWVVFDGPDPVEESGPGRVRPVFAPNADAWLLDRIGAGEPQRVALVTADRSLAERARRRGAEVVAPAAFLARCPG